MLGCALWAIGRAFGLERGYPLVALIAFTPYVAAASVLVLLAAVATRNRAAVVVAAIACAVLVGAVAPRLSGGEVGASPPGGPALRVATGNLMVAGASADDVVDLVRRERVDVLTLAEVDARAIRRLRAAGLDELLPNAVVRLGPGTSGTALFGRPDLEERPEIDGTANPHAVAVARVRGAAPVELVSVHPMAPATPERVRTWARDLDLLPEATPDGTVRVLAGDFNATLDHAKLRRLIDSGYRDAAEQLGDGLASTWPVGRRVPPVTIDHVLADRRCGIKRLTTHEIEGTDHRAVVADLVLPRRG